MEQSDSWDIGSPETVKKLPAFYGTRKFISVFRRSSQWPYREQNEYIPLTYTLIV